MLTPVIQAAWPETRNAAAVATSGGVPGRPAVRGGLVAPVHGDGGTAAGELGGDARPDASRAAGYQGDLPVEGTHAISPFTGVRISMRCPLESRK
jgi:hypothetical protein